MNKNLFHRAKDGGKKNRDRRLNCTGRGKKRGSGAKTEKKGGMRA